VCLLVLRREPLEGERAMCHVATLELPLDLRSAPRARTFLRGSLRSWELEDVADTLELPLSELVTNALLHARTPVVVTVTAVQRRVELTVRDGSAEAPQRRPERHDLDGDLEALRLAERGTSEQ